MKPCIRKTVKGEHCFMYHETLPWVLIIDGFYDLCPSFEVAVRHLNQRLCPHSSVSFLRNMDPDDVGRSYSKAVSLWRCQKCESVIGSMERVEI